MKESLHLLMLLCCLSMGCQTAWELHIIDNTSAGADGARCYDVNQDGSLEIVVGWEQGNVVRLYRETSAGQWIWVEVPAPQVEDALVVDLDEDGFPDIVSLSEGTTQLIRIHWAPDNWEEYWQSDAWQSEDVPVSVGKTRWMFGRAAQIDGEHGLDLVVGSKDPNGTLGWLQAPANPRDLADWQYHEICPLGWIMSIEVLDLNQDGAPDLLFTDRKGPQRGLKQAFHPGLDRVQDHSWQVETLGMEEVEPMFLDLYFGADGRPIGIWVADHQTGLWGFYRKREDPTQWEMRYRLPFPRGAGQIGKSVAIGDLNGDQVPDLVSSYEGAEGKRGVMATRHPIPTRGQKQYRIAGKAGIKYDFVTLIDLDGDGDLDVLTCEEANNAQNGQGLGVIWYENPRK